MVAAEDQMAQTARRYTSADILAMPDDGNLYEVIDGKLYVSTQPSWSHQMVCTVLTWALHGWSVETGAGRVNGAPGLVFAEDDDVAPDLVWLSNARLATALWPDGKLHAAPDLVVEVLSPGRANARRDREAKLDLYSRRGVTEYWIVDWQRQQVEVHRREGLPLRLVATLGEADTLESPLLPGFALPLERLFSDLPRAEG
jgi:Uma2 family endonuclease